MGGENMDILVMRDLIKDALGNYYVVSKIDGKKLTLVNAVVYYSYNRILDFEYVDEIKRNYKQSVGVGQPFTDIVKSRIEGLESGKYPGGIYPLEEVLKEYDIFVDGLYERNVTTIVKMEE